MTFYKEIVKVHSERDVKETHTYSAIAKFYTSILELEYLQARSRFFHFLKQKGVQRHYDTDLVNFHLMSTLLFFFPFPPLHQSSLISYYFYHLFSYLFLSSSTSNSPPKWNEQLSFFLRITHLIGWLRSVHIGAVLGLGNGTMVSMQNISCIYYKSCLLWLVSVIYANPYVLLIHIYLNS